MKTAVRKRTGGPLSALALGTGAALAATLLLAAVFACAMEREWIGEKSAGFVASGVLILAAGGGALLTAARYPKRRILVCMGTGSIYFLFLLLGAALFFDGDFSGLPVTAALVCGSAAAAGLLGLGPSGSRKKKYKRFRA